MLNYPAYQISFKIVTMTEKNTQKNKITMPQGSLLSLFSELLTNLLFEYKLNDSKKVKFPLMVYCYELMESTYNVKTLAQNKFKNVVESLSVIYSSYKSAENGSVTSSKSKGINRLVLFANLVGLGEKWNLKFLDHVLDFLAKFEDPLEIAGNKSSITETNFSEVYEIFFNPELCELNSENRNNLLKMMVSDNIFLTQILTKKFVANLNFFPSFFNYFDLLCSGHLFS